MGRHLANSVRALWIVASQPEGTRYRLITSRRFPTVEAAASDQAPDDQTVMAKLSTVDDLRQRCYLTLEDSMQLIISSSDRVSVLILPAISNDQIAIGTAALLSETFCSWISPYVADFDVNLLWSISTPLSLVFFHTMPFGEYLDDRPLSDVYNGLIHGTSLPPMLTPTSAALASVTVLEQTSCCFEGDLTPVGFRQVGAIQYEGSAPADTKLQISFLQNPDLRQLKVHEKASLENTLDKHVITFPPSKQMIIAKYDWMKPEVPISKYRFSIDAVKNDDTSLQALLEVTFSKFVQHVEILFELEQDTVVERSDSEVQISRVNEKTNEFRWPVGNVLTNGTIRKRIQWSSKHGRPLHKQRFIEIRCISSPNLELVDSADQVKYFNSNLNRNLYRLKFKSSNNNISKEDRQ